MKNIIKSALLVVMSLFLMTACSDDNDSNPTIQSPTEFKLNTPALHRPSAPAWRIRLRLC